MEKSKLGKTNLGSVTCHFCLGVKPVIMCKVVKVPGGGRAYKCRVCEEDDKKFASV